MLPSVVSNARGRGAERYPSSTVTFCDCRNRVTRPLSRSSDTRQLGRLAEAATITTRPRAALMSPRDASVKGVSTGASRLFRVSSAATCQRPSRTYRQTMRPADSKA